MSILIFIISLAVLILVHEFGHFIVAKKSGIRVDEFGLGLPPRLFGIQRVIGGEIEQSVSEEEIIVDGNIVASREQEVDVVKITKRWKFGTGSKLKPEEGSGTIYSINTIPFGGFVKIFGEDPIRDDDNELSVSNGDGDRSRSFQYKPKWVQSLVLAAGVTFNVIFAWLIISLGFSIGLPAPVGYMGYTEVRDAKTVLISVLPDSPAEKSGLRSGDALLSVSSGKIKLEGTEVSPEKVSELISGSMSKDIEISYKRGEEAPVTIAVSPTTDDSGKRMIGVAMDTIGTIKLPIHKALFEGARTTVLLTKSTAIGLFQFLYSAITFNADLSQVTGPVGIAGTFGQAKDLGFVFVLSLVSIISINLALINLIPFPALDGGRLFFILIEVIIRKPIPPKIFQWANAIGFALLILLMVVVTGHDIFNLL